MSLYNPAGICSTETFLSNLGYLPVQAIFRKERFSEFAAAQAYKIVVKIL